jgi:hypothetical protein
MSSDAERLVQIEFDAQSEQMNRAGLTIHIAGVTS